MMTSKITTLLDISTAMESWAPLDTAEPWDNCGIQLGDRGAKISSVLLSLDIDAHVLSFLESNSPDLIVTHHPLFFKTLKQIDYRSDVGKLLTPLISKGINVYTAHTNLDKAENGVNDALSEQFGFDPKQGRVIQDDLGKWYENSDSISIQDIASKFPSQVLGLEDTSRTPKRIGLCGGSGKSLLNAVYELGIDCFITGEISYHDEVFCNLNDISVICLGHKESEICILPKIESFLNKKFPMLNTTII